MSRARHPSSLTGTAACAESLQRADDLDSRDVLAEARLPLRDTWGSEEMIRRLLVASGAEAGQTLAEYGLLMAFLIVPVILLAIAGFREEIIWTFQTAAAVFP
jgi:Flp pilus assembly pilin Flp